VDHLTFAAIVQNICGKGYVKVQKRFLAPTASAYAAMRQLVGRFAFAQYDFTKELETQLDLIANGTSQYVPVVAALDQRLDQELGQLATQKPQFPCPKCGKALRQSVSKTGRKFFGCTGYRDGCEVLCEDDNGKPGPVIVRSDTPSDKQIEFARKLAGEQNLALPAETVASYKLLKVWIDKAKASAPPRLASDAQCRIIAKLIEEKGLEPPKGWPEACTMDAAGAFLDKHLSKKKGKSSGKRKVA